MEIVELDAIVEDDCKDWDLEGIMTLEEVEANELRGKICAMRENVALQA